MKNVCLLIWLSTSFFSCSQAQPPLSIQTANDFVPPYKGAFGYGSNMGYYKPHTDEEIADFAAKVGKLVDRRGALIKYLTLSGHPANVAAVLICRLPRDQIAVHEAELRAAKIILLTRKDLEETFMRVRVFTDPDRMLDDAVAALDRPAMPGR